MLPGVTVTAVNSADQRHDDRGHQRPGRLPAVVAGRPARYKVTFTLSSFAPIAREIEVRSGDRLRVDMALEIGGDDRGSAGRRGDAAPADGDARRAANVIDQATVESQPLSGRNPYALAYTLPGVTTQTTRESISFRPFDNGGMDNISINGGVTRSNEFLLDGAPNASREGTSQGSLAFVPSPDAVQEVRVSTNTYDAQFGRTGGGVIAVSIRSGTNTLPRHHLLQPPRRQSEQQPLREQGPRHSEGRPLPLQSRLHVRRPGAAAEVRRPEQDVLLLRLRGAEVGHSGLVRRARADRPRARRRLLAVGRDIYDPLTSVNGVPQPFPGNRIPANRLDPVAVNLLKYMVSPNTDARRDAEQLLRARATRASTPTRPASPASITTSAPTTASSRATATTAGARRAPRAAAKKRR